MSHRPYRHDIYVSAGHGLGDPGPVESSGVEDPHTGTGRGVRKGVWRKTLNGEGRGGKNHVCNVTTSECLSGWVKVLCSMFAFSTKSNV